MNTKGLLDQLLASGQAMLNQNLPAQQPGQPARSGGAAGGIGGLLGSDFTKGALSGGALGLLLGNKSVRKMGGGALKYGGVAALGALAYRAYSDWQQQQQAPGAAAAPAPRTVDRLPAPEVEVHSRAILQALVAAAKADGHIDERERGLIHNELGRLAEDPETRHWLEAELAKPLDPAEVARAASTPEIGVEMYLASLMAADQQNFMERAYLDELARQLKLDPALKDSLERQALPG
ncbi:tellurite resistance TerB family protein [Panacagrimonas sp.]|uniref:tellurite resistance TerB family protein n=1 Tax=Panacagrimonas sp. TaxID=2480088 RepID=UPI003B52C8E7